MLLARGPCCVLLLGVPLAAQGGADASGGIGALEDSAPEAGTYDPGHGSVSFRLGFYDHQDSGDGNPFLDEDLTVIEPVVVFDYDVSEDLGISVQLSYDYVSSASIDRLAEFPEQSGASGDNYIGGDLAFRHRLDENTDLRWHLGYSTEYDYNSIGAGANLTRRPPGTDATLDFGLHGYFDTIDIIRFDGTEEGDDDRTSITGSARWYQILTPDSFGEVGLTVAHQSGFLETPYNAVVVEDPALPPNPNLANNARGYEITEELPDDRLRIALDGRWRKRLAPGRALQLGGRLYGDSWGIYSVAVEPAWFHTLIEDKLHARLRYRYYTQTEADDYADSFTAEQSERTQDSDLADFDTHTVGAKLVWQKSENQRFDIGLDYSFRSDGLDHVFASVGWTWSF